MSLHQLSGRIRWRIWAGGRGWIWRIRAAVGIGRSRSCRCWSTDVVRLEGEGNDRLLPSFKQTPAFYSIYDAPSFLSLFFSSSFHPQKSGGRETKRILSSLFVLFSLQPFLSLYLFFRDIDNPEGVKITGIHLFRINGDWLLIKLKERTEAIRSIRRWGGSKITRGGVILIHGDRCTLNPFWIINRTNLKLLLLNYNNYSL